MTQRKAVAEDLGLAFRDRLTFDYPTMTVSGCKCRGCWEWKTKPENRRFWMENT